MRTESRYYNLLATYSDWFPFLHSPRIYFPGKVESSSWRKHFEARAGAETTCKLNASIMDQKYRHVVNAFVSLNVSFAFKHKKKSKHKPNEWFCHFNKYIFHICANTCQVERRCKRMTAYAINAQHNGRAHFTFPIYKRNVFYFSLRKNYIISGYLRGQPGHLDTLPETTRQCPSNFRVLRITWRC